MTFTKIEDTGFMLKFKSLDKKFQINIYCADDEDQTARFSVSLFAGASGDWIGSYEWDEDNMIVPMNSIPEKFFGMVKEVVATEGFNIYDF